MNLLENDFWGTPLSDTGSHGSYRPFCVFTFRLNYLLGGFQPWGYHLVNVLLHVLATGLVVRVARIILPSTNKLTPAIAGLLFASHPIHTEAVAGIVGRADLAACNFYLLSFLIYVLHVKYRDNMCLQVMLNHYCACCDSVKRNMGKRIKKQTESDVSTKYRNFFLYLRKQVTNVANTTTPNEFCCMRHNFVLPAFSATFNQSGFHQYSDFGLFKFEQKSVETEQTNWCKCTKNVDNVCVIRAVKQWLAFIACVLCATAAVLSKETGISVLFVCALYDWIYSSSRGTNKVCRTNFLFILSSSSRWWPF